VEREGNQVISVPAALSSAAVFDNRKLVLRLDRDEDGRVSVLSCEVFGSGLVNRTLFNGSTDLKDVIVDDLANAVRDQIMAVGAKHQVLSLPEFLIELPGLTLSTLHLIAAEMRNGVQRFILRFQTFLGSLGRVLKANIGFEPAPASNSDVVSLAVLYDIATPLLNLCNFKDIDARSDRERLEIAHRTLSERADEITFYVELLKRFSVRSNPSRLDEMDQKPVDRRQISEVS
jgi:hypothetical protein